MNWLHRHAQALQAAASLVTALIAIVAVLAVKYQVDEAAALSRAQAARDIYREHLALSIANPDFAEPQDACALMDSPRGPGYRAYVEHILYTAEQVIEIDAVWSDTFATILPTHSVYLCESVDPKGYTTPVETLLKAHESAQCSTRIPCPGG